MKSGESEQKENIIGGIHKIVKQVINFFFLSKTIGTACVSYLYLHLFPLAIINFLLFQGLECGPDPQVPHGKWPVGQTPYSHWCDALPGIQVG